MKRFPALALVLLLLIGGCAAHATAWAPQTSTFPPEVVEAVSQHIVTVIVYFEVSKEAADRIRADRKKAPIFRGWQDTWKLIVDVEPSAGDNEFVVFVGSGTLLENNLILTVAHLFTDSDPALRNAPLTVWVLAKGLDHAVLADVVAVTGFGNLGTETFWKDYCLIAPREDLGRPGVKIAQEQPPEGSPVVFAGSVHGSAFFVRFGFLTSFQQYLRSGSDDALHLSQWTDFALMTVYPGGSGDSGGGVFNAAGELVGVIYCGMDIAGEGYLFSNPLHILKAFLAEAFKAVGW